jgi:hypothetical protein
MPSRAALRTSFGRSWRSGRYRDWQRRLLDSLDALFCERYGRDGNAIEVGHLYDSWRVPFAALARENGFTPEDIDEAAAALTARGGESSSSSRASTGDISSSRP